MSSCTVLVKVEGFAYLRFNFADPPRQVYWGTASPRQHRYLAGLFDARYTEFENTTFKYSWRKATQALDAGNPPIMGPLGHVSPPFLPADLSPAQHIPIHYLLLIGYDDATAYVHDTGLGSVQALPLSELEPAWDVNSPGLGKRNRLVILELPMEIATTSSLIRRSIHDQSSMMLKPPVSMLGIPAMQKLSREIAAWPQELGEQVSRSCLRQVREYLNSPPDVLGDHLTAGRDIYIAFLEQAATIVGLDFSKGVDLFRTSMSIIPKIAVSIQHDDLAGASAGFAEIAELEKEAFTVLTQCVD